MSMLNVIYHLQLFQIEKPLQRHGGRLEHNETYCGSCYGAEMVCFSLNFYPVSVDFSSGNLFPSNKCATLGLVVPLFYFLFFKIPVVEFIFQAHAEGV